MRYMVGTSDRGENQYRVCEVVGVQPYKMYQFQNVRDDRKLTLKHGKSERAWTMEQVSQSAFTDVRSSVSTGPLFTACAVV